MEKCFQEAVRYLGYGKNPVDEATSRLVEKGFLELEKVSALRSVFRIFEMNRIDEEKVAIGTLQISSKSLARNLNHCEKAVLFGATLGTGVDRLIARTSLTDMANAVVLQACAAAMLEEFCDEKQFEIGEELEKVFICARGSVRDTAILISVFRNHLCRCWIVQRQSDLR